MAVLFHAIEYGEECGANEISLETVKMAIEFSEWQINHQLHLFEVSRIMKSDLMEKLVNRVFEKYSGKFSLTDAGATKWFLKEFSGRKEMKDTLERLAVDGFLHKFEWPSGNNKMVSACLI